VFKCLSCQFLCFASWDEIYDGFLPALESFRPEIVPRECIWISSPTARISDAESPNRWLRLSDRLLAINAAVWKSVAQWCIFHKRQSHCLPSCMCLHPSHSQLLGNAKYWCLTKMSFFFGKHLVSNCFQSHDLFPISHVGNESSPATTRRIWHLVNRDSELNRFHTPRRIAAAKYPVISSPNSTWPLQERQCRNILNESARFVGFGLGVANSNRCGEFRFLEGILVNLTNSIETLTDGSVSIAREKRMVNWSCIW